MMRQWFTRFLFILFILGLGGTPAMAQGTVAPGTPATPVVVTGPTLIPISATAAVNTATTLTIPAPPGGQYNYICYLAWEGSNDNTATVVTNAVTTSTNFNAFALKFSVPSAASNDTGTQVVLSATSPGMCAKSASPGTATTFVSPSGMTHEAFTWMAIYWQGF